MDDWEQMADEGTKVVIPPKVPNPNKWEGEDEEEDVKESWEDDEKEEEKKDEEKVETTPVKTKPKKNIQQKIAEKEAKKRELLAQRADEDEEENLSPEEKHRRQKLQEDADLKTALDTLGIVGGGEQSGIDGRNPTTPEEFTELAEAISRKVSQFKNREEFPTLIEDLVRNICATLSSNNIRKIKTTVDNLYLEKQKLEKGDKPKKAKGGKVKARLRVEQDNTKLDEYVTKYDDYGGDDYDDFM